MALALKQKPSWLSQTALIVAPVAEPHYHLRYAGQAGADDSGNGSSDSDERLDALTQAGVTLVSIPFYRGYGADFEQATMEQAADTIQRARTRGLRTATRVTIGAVTPETLLAEEPESHNWLQVNADGQPCVLTSTTPGVRVRPCYQSEAYQRYIEKICLRAVESGADLLVLQDLAYNPEPDTCRCPLCVSAFRERLRELYGPQTEETRSAGHDRFGHHNFGHVRPPLYRSRHEGIPAELVSPHEQEWQLFKIRTLSRFLARLSKAAERQNGECAIAADVLRATEIEARSAGLDLCELLPLLDVAAFPAGTTVHGQADRVHAVRRSHAFGVTACLPHATETSCETVALQPQGPLCREDCTDVECNGNNAALVEFHRQHWDHLFSGSRQVARIGVFCDPNSLQFSSAEPHAALTAVERFLVDRHLPYALLAPAQLGDLAPYACVVVAGAACLDEASAALLKSYAEAGGGLVVTGASSGRDTWYRLRPAPLAADWFGSEEQQPTQAVLGQGRVARLSGTENEPALAEALRFAMGDPSLRVAARSGCFLLTHHRLPSGAQTLHLVSSPDTPASGLEFALSCEQTPQEVAVYAPGCEPKPVAFTFSEAAQQLSFCLNELPLYAVVRIAAAV